MRGWRSSATATRVASLEDDLTQPAPRCAARCGAHVRCRRSWTSAAPGSANWRSRSRPAEQRDQELRGAVRRRPPPRASLQAERDRLQQERDQLQAQLGTAVRAGRRAAARCPRQRGAGPGPGAARRQPDQGGPDAEELEEGIRQRELEDSASRGVVLSSIAGIEDQTLLEGGRIRLPSGVLFESGSADLSEGGKQTLAEFARRMRRVIDEMPPMASWMLRIDGHTDDRARSGAGSRWRDNLELVDRAGRVPSRST